MPADQDIIPSLPPRLPDSHKGHYGRALLIGGSRGMTGAIGLAGMATLRSGAGLVTLAVPNACLDVVAGYEPSYMTRGLASDSQGRIAAESVETISELVAGMTCIACGPGLGRSDELDDLVCGLYQTVSKPLVLDADALNALGPVWRNLTADGPRILTPHPGEFRRLVGCDNLSDDKIRDMAIDLANDQSVVIVLKGARTLVTDGQREFRNSTGNPGMATGGSGDVLTGVITALVAQELAPMDAACLGVHVHGLAGDLAVAELGQTSLIASDLVRYLPDAFRQIGSA